MLDINAYPAGNFTLVFTDIENSSTITSELEQTRIGTYEKKLRDPQRKRLLRLAAKHNGYEIHRAGDGHLLVFQFATDALACVVAFQKQLHANPITYTEDGKIYEIKVRVGVHTAVDQRRPTMMENGLPEYPGSDTNYAARVGNYGRGGCIIVSQSTYNSTHNLSDYKKPPYNIHPLPGCSLKSFSGSHDLYEILYFNGQETFESGTRLIPEWYKGETNPYVSRPTLQKTVIEHFKQKDNHVRTRLVTLLADGGMGKTRLAITCAVEMAAMFKEGVYFVDLSEQSFCTRAAVAEAIGSAMKLAGVNLQPDNLLELLKDSERLVVLDNYEAMESKEVNQFLGEMINKTTAVCLLVTGRTAVKLDVEQIVSMNTGMEPQQAKEMFLTYARRKKSEQAWTPDAAEEENIRRITKLTEGIPLAVELAAGWVGEEPIQSIADGLQATPLGEMSGVPEQTERANQLQRHYSLTRSMDWSHNLLGAEVQHFFYTLSLFADSFTEETVSIIANRYIDKNRSSLRVLHRVSLLQRNEVDGVNRYRFHRFTKAYAEAKLEELISRSREIIERTEPVLGLEEIIAMKKRLAKYFLDLARDTAPLAKKLEPENKKKVDRLESEIQNLDAALEWCVKKDVSLGLRVATDLWNFWWMRGYASMGTARLESLLEKADASLPERAEAASVAGHLYRHIGEFKRAKELYDESLRAFPAQGKSSGAARVMRHLGILSWHQDDWDTAKKYLNDALQKSETERDKAESLYELGNLARSQEHYEEAAQLISESLVHFRSKGENNDPRWLATALLALGNVTFRLKSIDETRQHYAESLKLFTDIKEKGRLPLIFERIAAFVHQERPNEATILIGAASKIRKDNGSPLPEPDRKEYYDKLFADLKQALGTEADYEKAYEQGQLMPLSDAIKVAHDQVKPL